MTGGQQTDTGHLHDRGIGEPLLVSTLPQNALWYYS